MLVRAQRALERSVYLLQARKAVLCTNRATALMWGLEDNWDIEGDKMVKCMVGRGKAVRRLLEDVKMKQDQGCRTLCHHL